MRRNPSDTASETYKLEIVTFENGQPEEFLKLMKNYNGGGKNQLPTYYVTWVSTSRV